MDLQLLAERLEQLILKRVADDNVPLPTLPAVAVKLIEMLKDPDLSFERAGAILETDPLLSARVVRVATSAAYGASGKDLSLKQLLARLGTRNLRTVLVEASLQKVFVSRDPKIATALHQLWQHSVAVGLLARDIAALAGSPDSEPAHLAGLLHDVGKPIVATILLDAERQVLETRSNSWLDSDAWLQAVGRGHRKVGTALAEKWRMPAFIAQSIRDSGEFNQADRSSVSNFVCLGNALAKQAGIAAGPVDDDDNNALVMIGRSMLGIPDEAVQRLASTVRPRIKTLYD